MPMFGDGTVPFRCCVVITNSTGSSLPVKTFAGYLEFDHLFLVVMAEDGTELGRVSSTAHDSILATNGRWLSLAKGANAKQLDFLVPSLPRHLQSCKVQVIGTLPGSGVPGELRSNLMKIKVR